MSSAVPRRAAALSRAPVAKLVDALDLGSSNASCVGSSPIRRTKLSVLVLFKTMIFNGINKIDADSFFMFLFYWFIMKVK